MMTAKPATGRYCCVPQCNSSGMRCKGQVSFFKFPSDSKLQKVWIIKIRRTPGKTFKIGQHTLVCSKHFKEDDMVTQGGDCLKRRVLKPNAVPTIFNFKKQDVHKMKRTQKVLNEEDVNEHDRLEELAIQEHVSSDHRYTCENIREKELNRSLQSALNVIEMQKEQILELQNKYKFFCFERYKDDSKAIHHFTGFSSCGKFQQFFIFIEPQTEDMVYCESENTDCNKNINSVKNQKTKTERVLDRRNEFFLTMVRLRRGWSENDLALLFGISVSAVNTIVITWINLLYFALRGLPIWPTRELLQKHMPEKYKKKLPNLRVIIDATELFVEHPSAPPSQSSMFSHYERHATFKSLIGVVPDTSVVFVSELYEGSLSDEEIVMRSGLLNVLEMGDQVLSNKEFNISKELESVGAILIVSPTKDSSKSQMSKHDVSKTREIANLRAIVEKVIGSIKSFKICSHIIPLALAGVATRMWVVCALFTNYL